MDIEEELNKLPEEEKQKYLLDLSKNLQKQIREFIKFPEKYNEARKQYLKNKFEKK